MKVKINGKWSKHRKPAPSVMHGFRCENVRLNRHDMRELAGLPDDELCARVRQISARANRKDTGPFHSGGFVGTPTGRRPSWPEMQFPPGTRTGRWSSDMPLKSQMPRPNKVEVRVLDESHHLKPGLVNADFADIEKRVMAQVGLDLGKEPSRSSVFEVHARQHGKTLRHARAITDALTRAIVSKMVEEAWQKVQNDIDEEGCGAAFAALKEWPE